MRETFTALIKSQIGQIDKQTEGLNKIDLKLSSVDNILLNPVFHKTPSSNS